MLEVSFYTEELFDLTLNLGGYHKLRDFAEVDLAADDYVELQYKLGEQ